MYASEAWGERDNNQATDIKLISTNSCLFSTAGNLRIGWCISEVWRCSRCFPTSGYPTKVETILLYWPRISHLLFFD